LSLTNFPAAEPAAVPAARLPCLAEALVVSSWAGALAAWPGSGEDGANTLVWRYLSSPCLASIIRFTLLVRSSLLIIQQPGEKSSAQHASRRLARMPQGLFTARRPYGAERSPAGSISS
jgi:hypothetical protein